MVREASRASEETTSSMRVMTTLLPKTALFAYTVFVACKANGHHLGRTSKDVI